MLVCEEQNSNSVKCCFLHSSGDHKVSTQGPLPSPISDLDLTAEGYGKKCFIYVMLSPGGEMMCRDKNGKIVATTAEEMLQTGNYVRIGSDS